MLLSYLCYIFWTKSDLFNQVEILLAQYPVKKKGPNNLNGTKENSW